MTIYNKRFNKNIPLNAVLIDRTTKWGNPFVIRQTHNGYLITRELAIRFYEDWLLYSDQGQKVLADIEELMGEDLVCWCAPASCHGEILQREAEKAKSYPRI